MDARHFDRLARALSETGPRRGLLGLFATLPVLGGLVALLDFDDAEAKGRRKRRKKAHKHGKGRRRKHHKKCQPNSKSTTCAGGKCGPVVNNCKKTVDCGSCSCTPACGECFTCQGEPGALGTCVPQQAGTPCGVATFCSAGTLFPQGSCDGDGNCLSSTEVPCYPYSQCDGNACATTCGNSDDCIDGFFCDDDHCVSEQDDGQPCTTPNQCQSGFCATGVCCQTACDGACEVCNDSGDGTCTTVADGGTCGDEAICCSGSCESGVCCGDGMCSAQAPDCEDHQCTCDGGAACAGDPELCCAGACVNTDTSRQNCGACGHACGADQLCVDGACLDCTVTCDAADHSCQSHELQDAIDEGGTVVVCPGRYGPATLRIEEANVTIIGAGQGDDPSVDTILLGSLRVFFNDVTTTLRQLYIAGGRRPSAFGGAAFTNFSNGRLTVTDCTIAQNQTVADEDGNACGVIVNDGRLEMTRCTVRDNSVSNAHAEGTSVGGGVCNSGELVMTDCVIRDNAAQGGGSALGGGLYTAVGTVELTRCRITENTVTAPVTGAGGIQNASGSSLDLTDSFVWDNTAPDCAGDITVVGSGGCGAVPPTDEQAAG